MQRQISLCALALGTMMGVSLPVHAHLGGFHQMQIVDGLMHLFTQPIHLLLMSPALALAAFYVIRKIRRRWRPDH